MSAITFFLIFIPILSLILLSVNLILAPHMPYKEKKTPFECGYHSFLWQNRTQFTIMFFVFGLLFLLFDLEIVLIFPFAVTSKLNSLYGLAVLILFALIVTIGFVFELGKNALTIESKQSKHMLHSSVSESLNQIICSFEHITLRDLNNLKEIYLNDLSGSISEAYCSF